MHQHYQRWSELAPRGLLLIGAGVSVVGSAIQMRTQKKHFLRWFLRGFVGLVILNSGVAIFAEATKHRALFEIKQEQADTVAQI